MFSRRSWQAEPFLQCRPTDTRRPPGLRGNGEVGSGVCSGAFGAFASQHGEFRFGDGPALLDRVGFDVGMVFGTQLANAGDASGFGRGLSTHFLNRRLLGGFRFGFGFRAHVQTCVDGFDVVGGFGFGVVGFVAGVFDVGVVAGGHSGFRVVVGTKSDEGDFAEC